MWTLLLGLAKKILRSPMLILILTLVGVLIWGVYQQRAKDKALDQVRALKGTVQAVSTSLTIAMKKAEVDHDRIKQLQKINSDPGGWLDDYFRCRRPARPRLHLSTMPKNPCRTFPRTVPAPAR